MTLVADFFFFPTFRLRSSDTSRRVLDEFMYLNSMLLESSDAEEVNMRDCVPLGLYIRP